MNKSAVEWAINEIRNNWYDYEYGDADMNDLIKQAKVMEKEQIKDAFNFGVYDGGGVIKKYKMSGEQYYNKTYKK